MSYYDEPEPFLDDINEQEEDPYQIRCKFCLLGHLKWSHRPNGASFLEDEEGKEHICPKKNTANVNREFKDLGDE